MTTLILFFVLAVACFVFGFFVGVNNSKKAQQKIDEAKNAADAAKNILKKQ